MGAAGQPDAVKLAWSEFRRLAPARGYAQAWLAALGNQRTSQRKLVAEPEQFFRKNGLLLCLQRSEYRLPFVWNYHWMCFQLSELSVLNQNFEFSNQKQQTKILVSPNKQGSVKVLSTINHETELWYCLKQLLSLEIRFFLRMTLWMNRTMANIG